jgi:hypothetical protein
VNTFDFVLHVIKEHCEEIDVPSKECFEQVKSKLDEQDQVQLDFYLDFLQDLGLIEYNGNNHLIVLTAAGKYTDHLFN